MGTIRDKISKFRWEIAFKKELKEGHYLTAAEIGKEHELDDEKVKGAANKAFENELEQENYEEAASIGKKYELNKDKVKDVATRAFKEMLEQGNFKRAVEIGGEYGLDEEEIKEAKNKTFDKILEGSGGRTLRRMDMILPMIRMVPDFFKSGKEEKAKSELEELLEKEKKKEKK